MKFGKTYTALIYDPAFPQDWRDKAINYGQLKKLINQVVLELQSLGLNPDVLQRLMVDGVSLQLERQTTRSPRITSDEGRPDINEPSVIYEVSSSLQSQTIVPQIRLRLPSRENGTVISSRDQADNGLEVPEGDGDATTDPSLMSSSVPLRTSDPLWALRQKRLSSVSAAPSAVSSDLPSPPGSPLHSASFPLAVFETPNADPAEVVIPLASDSAFFQLLSGALAALTALYTTILKHCEAEVHILSSSIADSARPVSESKKSDLETWRDIFQLWVESEIFESLNERTHGERTVQDSETRLMRFADEVVTRNLDDRKAFRVPGSRDALRRFYALNVLVLDLKKFQLANSEATRKILKKHEKRTSLPSSVVLPSLNLVVRGNESLPHVMLCLITQTLLPVVPSIDDYQCLICTSIAFKPIRLACGHLFCVRCLVKMQKKGTPEYANCPLCRSPTVFTADKSNLDVALMNFMTDWFPKESRIKAKENGDEAAKEMAQEMGLDSGCRIM